MWRAGYNTLFKLCNTDGDTLTHALGLPAGADRMYATHVAAPKPVPPLGMNDRFAEYIPGPAMSCRKRGG